MRFGRRLDDGSSRWERFRPPGFGRSRTWRSPLRGIRLTSVLGMVLLVALPIVVLTGLLSYVAYGPRFGQAMPAETGWLRLPLFDWPTRPAWLYRLNQGVHVLLGLVLVPVVLAKLWSVIPKLFAWPPVTSPARALERLSLLLLVGSVLFELGTGVLNVQYYYAFPFSFYTAHYWGAWVFIGSFAAHVALKLPAAVRALRHRGGHDDLAPVRPAAATMSRRGFLAVVAGGSALIGLLTAGQTFDGARRTALLSPRYRDGPGPNGFQVNRTAAAAGIAAASTGPRWRLRLLGGAEPVELDRARLLALPQRTAELPIACVEGWSTTQRWTGVPLAELARLAGVSEPASAHVRSLETGGAFAAATLHAGQVLDPDALLALRVNGVDLSPDHGFPARVIVPALPGVLNTKWVASISFRRR
ncbi:molybdopterin-dependent oxidoreductase [Saccharopolyspora gregorii]|uniref:molybdopterin-dependent oxidoreductase n=1 Tax=Saccharopolyspora gregorii TaxID=33914 RepID=UPI0021AD4224|nr:molybdopterin-dependent oxidoreductase [Saccharopolyspora gregorii]